jgi:hypothetical protein
MTAIAAALVLVFGLLFPTGNTAAAAALHGDIRTDLAFQPNDETDIIVYDYTTVGTVWTPLIIGTVEEFNAVKPPTAPRLIYQAAAGDTDSLDLGDRVWDLSGIIICDTYRPEDFPDDPNAPADGWGGVAQMRDADTIVIALNNAVPEGYYLPIEVADNTVCHEMMHAYTFVEDDYGADPLGSCVWGDLLSPGPTDVQLMQARYPTPVVNVSPADEEPSLWDRTKALGREVGEQVCGFIPHVDISFLWESGKATGGAVREQIDDTIQDLGIDMPDVGIDLPDVDVDVPDVDIPLPDVALPHCGP